MHGKQNAAMDGSLDVKRSREAAAQLLTMVDNMVADGDLDDLEIEFLRAWLVEHSDISQAEPGATITRALENMLADGHVSELERTYLMEALQQLSLDS